MRPFRCCLIVVVALIALAAAPAPAQTLLRWNLPTNSSFTVNIIQSTQSRVAFSSKSADSKIDLSMQLTWHVAAADESAIAIKQTIDRLTTTVASPTGTAEYDSSAKTRPVGLAKDLADSLRPLVGAEIEIVITPRGEVTKTRPLNEAAEKLFAGENTPGDPAAVPRNTFEQAVSRSILQLPENAVKPGDTWTTAREITAPAAAIRHETTYTFEKTIDKDGAQLAQLSTSSKLLPTESKNAPIRIQSHDQSGTILFSTELGRVVESHETQKLVTERAYRDTTIVVTLISTQKTVITPVTAAIEDKANRRQ